MEYLVISLSFLLGSAFAGFAVYRKLAQRLTALNAENLALSTCFKIKENEVLALQTQINSTQEMLKSEYEKLNGEILKSAAIEFQRNQLKTENDILSEDTKNKSSEIQALTKTNNLQGQEISTLRERISSLEEYKRSAVSDTFDKCKEFERVIKELRDQKSVLEKEVVILKQTEPALQKQFSENVQVLTIALDGHKQRLLKEEEDKKQSEVKRLEYLKQTWARHEKNVEDEMLVICQQESVEYIEKEKFPHTGKPDNSIKIAEEYIIFDSKSPQGEDLSNFPTYLKNQAETAKKYAKHDEVKKEIFFVVPTNAIDALDDTFVNLGGYCVHIISLDALRPIIKLLKKIENYEFAEQLSPDDREQIAKVIGRMAHTMKRRVQINQFMDNEYISTLMESDKLPGDLLVECKNVERSSKFKTPVGKRGKMLELSTLQNENKKLVGKVIGQEIHSGPELGMIDQLPLHISDSEEN